MRSLVNKEVNLKIIKLFKKEIYILLFKKNIKIVKKKKRITILKIYLKKKELLKKQ